MSNRTNRLSLLGLATALALFTLGKLHAQQVLTVHNQVVTAPYPNYDLGADGLNIDLALYFAEYMDDPEDRLYRLDFDLKTPDGQVVYTSRTKPSILVRAVPPLYESTKAGMVASDLSLFAPFREIKLPLGPQKVILELTLRNNRREFPAFHTSEISFRQEADEATAVKQQEFRVLKPEIVHHVDVPLEDTRGMQVTFKMYFRYGAGDVAEDQYDLTFKVLSPDRSQDMYLSRTSHADEHEERIRIRGPVEEALTVTFFVSYARLKMNGPGDVLIVLDAAAPLMGKRELYAQQHSIPMPKKMPYADQGFTASNVTAAQARHDGVSGLAIKFHCRFKHTGLISDQVDPVYSFSLVLARPEGDTLLRSTQFDRDEDGTTKLWSAHESYDANGGVQVSFFIPFHWLRLPKGTHTLQFAISPSSKDRLVRFPIVAKGSVQVNVPKTLHYRMTITEMEVKAGEGYDVPILSKKHEMPDLQSFLWVGKDDLCASKITPHSYVAGTSVGNFTICEGDPIRLTVVDDDIFFDDYLGGWSIPYAGKGDKFTFSIKNQGYFKTLSVVFEGK